MIQKSSPRVTGFRSFSAPWAYRRPPRRAALRPGVRLETEEEDSGLQQRNPGNCRSVVQVRYKACCFVWRMTMFDLAPRNKCLFLIERLGHGIRLYLNVSGSCSQLVQAGKPCSIPTSLR
jgi:hypothetical protein